MSAIWFSVLALFNDKEQCDVVHKGLALAAEGEVKKARAYFRKLGEKEIIDQSWHIESYERGERVVNAQIQAPISSLDPAEFISSIERLGATHILADITNDQVDATLNIARIRRKRATAKQVVQDLKVADPSIALGMAVEKGKIQEIKQLLKAGANPNMRIGGAPLLAIAAAGERVDIVRALVDAGADPNIYVRTKFSDGVRPDKTALHYAVHNDNALEMAKVLVAAGANVNATDPNESTPLHDACSKGNLAVVKLLVEAGGAVNAEDYEGRTPAFMLILQGEVHAAEAVAFLEYLASKGADLHHVDHEGGNLLYHWRGNGDSTSDVGEWLQRAGVAIKLPVDYYSGDRYQQLKNTIVIGDYEKFIELIGGGRSQWSESEFNKAWEDAITYGQLRMVEKLVDLGADPKQAIGNDTPMVIAVRMSHMEVAKYLLKHGANPNVVPDDCSTPLASAIEAENADMLRLLLENGADPTWPDRYEPALLVFAARRRSTEAVKLLLDAGLDVNAPSSELNGIAPLGAAVFFNQYSHMKLLIDAGASLDHRNDRGETALMWALSGPDETPARILLEAGADLAVLDENGNSAESYAQSRKMKTLVKEYAKK